MVSAIYPLHTFLQCNLVICSSRGGIYLSTHWTWVSTVPSHIQQKWLVSALGIALNWSGSFHSSPLAPVHWAVRCPNHMEGPHGWGVVPVYTTAKLPAQSHQLVATWVSRLEVWAHPSLHCRPTACGTDEPLGCIQSAHRVIRKKKGCCSKKLSFREIVVQKSTTGPRQDERHCKAILVLTSLTSSLTFRTCSSMGV